MQTAERAVLIPADEVVVQRAARRQILGDRRPLAPVLRIYIKPLTTSRTSTVRLLPLRLAGGITGAASAYSLSVRSLG